MPDRTPSRTPSPPLGGGRGDGVEAAGSQEGPNPVHRDGVRDITCARCPSPILAGAPRFSELVIYDLRVIGDLRTLAVERVDEYHPGCWAAESVEGDRA